MFFEIKCASPEVSPRYWIIASLKKVGDCRSLAMRAVGSGVLYPCCVDGALQRIPDNLQFSVW